MSILDQLERLEPKPVARGTTNGNRRGSAEDRRRRREWLVMTYRANVDVVVALLPIKRHRVRIVPLGEGEPACRCYRCGTLLTVDTVTVDRIIPGCQGGTYRRDNIRPACAHDNSSTGGKLAKRGKR